MRFRLGQQKIEIWMLQSRVFVKSDRWRLATSHGTRVYRGPIVDAATYAHIAGTYLPESGPPLVLSWHGGGIIAKWPDTGTTTQIFPVTPTEFEDGYRRLKFTVGPDGRATTVLGIEDQKEVLRAVRQQGK